MKILTPIGPDWGWKLRLIEIAFLPLSAVFYMVMGVHWVIEKGLEKIWH